MVYVGSASDGKFDQELDSVLVGPIPVGVNKFVFHVRQSFRLSPRIDLSNTFTITQANAPDPSKIPRHDLLGVTVVMVTCFYRNQEFIRIGYYVNNELCDENVSAASNITSMSKTDDGDDMEVDEDHMELAPDEDSNSRPVELSKKADVAKIRRNILAAKPRVTRYIINWDDEEEESTTAAATDDV